MEDYFIISRSKPKPIPFSFPYFHFDIKLPLPTFSIILPTIYIPMWREYEPTEKDSI